MALSATTDWSKIRYIMFVLFFVSALLASTVATGIMTSGKQKRQLFREHLLPQQGGKIPDGAFDPHRINTNRLNQNGFYSLDGYHFDQRRPDRQFLHKKAFPNTLKVNLYPDNRFVAPAGQSHGVRAVDTSYLLRPPVNYGLYPQFKYYSPLPNFPHDSLKLVRQFKYGKRNNQQEGNWNEVSSPNEFPEKIFQELAPYLRKLHETD